MHEQYQKAGFKMLPSGAPDQSTAFQIVFYTLWTIVISLVPVYYETGQLVLSNNAVIGVGLLGFIFLIYSLRLMYYKSDAAARHLLRMSILYITGIQMVYVIDKMVMV
jgi:protoheme IX farnesyltransferase